MRKKTILILTIIFFLSTTGLPISLHYCQMQGSTSLSDCEMCLTQEKDEESSCCEKEENFPIQIKQDFTEGCCVNKVIDSSVKDNFVSNKNEVRNSINIFLTAFTVSDITQSIRCGTAHLSFYDSSPPSIKNNIYLFNSILLI